MRGLYIPVCHTLRMLGKSVLPASENLYIVMRTIVSFGPGPKTTKIVDCSASNWKPASAGPSK